MAKRREKNIIFNLIDDIDPNAFVTESNVQAVMGEGFDKFKPRHNSLKDGDMPLTKE